jgi:hypothetical protein
VKGGCRDQRKDDGESNEKQQAERKRSRSLKHDVSKNLAEAPESKYVIETGIKATTRAKEAWEKSLLRMHSG